MGKAIIVCGSPGAGKTHYGSAIAGTSGAVLLDIDTCTERLVRTGLRESGRREDDRDSDYFKRTYRDPIYETLFDIARMNAPHSDVVIVGPFTRELRDPRWPETLAVRLGCPIEIHYIYCEPRVRYLRLVERANPRDELKFENWEEFNRYYGDESPPKFQHVFVDTTHVHALRHLVP